MGYQLKDPPSGMANAFQGSVTFLHMMVYTSQTHANGEELPCTK